LCGHTEMQRHDQVPGLVYCGLAAVAGLDTCLCHRDEDTATRRAVSLRRANKRPHTRAGVSKTFGTLLADIPPGATLALKGTAETVFTSPLSRRLRAGLLAAPPVRAGRGYIQPFQEPPRR
jgi:hypothetical protein